MNDILWVASFTSDLITAGTGSSTSRKGFRPADVNVVRVTCGWSPMRIVNFSLGDATLLDSPSGFIVYPNSSIEFDLWLPYQSVPGDVHINASTELSAFVYNLERASGKDSSVCFMLGRRRKE